MDTNNEDIKNIGTTITTILKDVAVTPEVKEALIGLYTLASYELLFKTLLTFQSSNKEFITNTTNLFNKAIERFTPEQLEGFKQAFEDEKKILLERLIIKFADSLPTKERQTIKNNLDKLIQ
jgi:hypothetical protein